MTALAARHGLHSMPAWDREGRDWPNRAASRFVQAAGLRWHVQVMGAGPTVVLAHGTGSATHSWRDLAPLLASRFTVVAPDLPGHGFTQLPAPPGLSLAAMARSLAALLHALDATPPLVVGHSAGAAVLARMSIDGQIAPGVLVSLNGALLPFRGVAGQVFAPLARLLLDTPLVPRLFAWRADDPARVERLIRNTGSVIDRAGVELYRRLVRNPSHVAAALGMMARWDLEGLERDLSRLNPLLVQMVGERDRAIPPGEARKVARIVPRGRVHLLPGLGHLAHEERPQAIADLIVATAEAAGILPAGPGGC